MVANFQGSAAQVLNFASVAVTTPTHAASGTAGVWDGYATATATCTGVKRGDIVLASMIEAEVTSQRFVRAFASADDTVTFVFWADTKNAGLTGAAKTFNVQAYEKS